MDATQALKDTENTLRDFIADVLERKFGADWVSKCGVSDDHRAEWTKRKEVEALRQRAGTVEERLLYYAHFFDLETILKKHWDGEFSAALGEWKTMQVWLNELGKLRDPDAHRRQLLPHQEALAVGIAGEIRTRLIRYRSKLETAEDCFPRIEVVRDSVGNLYLHPGAGKSKVSLRQGDSIDFVVTASDPLGEPLKYAMTQHGHHIVAEADWQEDNTFHWRATTVARSFGVYFWIRCSREHHAHSGYDDILHTFYDVLPAKSKP